VSSAVLGQDGRCHAGLAGADLCGTMTCVSRLARAKRKERPAKIRRARVVTVAPSGRVAMIERYVNGRTFLSVPGGRLEPGESPEQGALREIEEELGLQVTLAGHLADLDRQAYFLAVVPEETPLRLSGPELRHATARNRYTPRWVDGTTLDGLPLRQAGVRPLLTAAVLAVAATVTATEVPAEIEPEAQTPDEAQAADDGPATDEVQPPPTEPSPRPAPRLEAPVPYFRPLRSRFVFRRRRTGSEYRNRISA
jgi:8-oxo-dGTP pyrophosphatase MutT (NUDIX family)